jgi:energy-coupling factor transporter ATP-binding protein EcfA2
MTSRRQPADSAPVAYFLELQVENVLCFKGRQMLDLTDCNGNPAQWTVILGDNGVGKTTLLRCLAGMEVKFTGSGENYRVSPLLFVSLSSPSLLAWQELEPLYWAGAGVSASIACGTSLSALQQDSELPFAEAVIEVFGDSYYEIDGRSPDLAGLLCYGYGATRVMGKTLLSESPASENSASLFSDRALLINAEEWLLQTDYAMRSTSGKSRQRLEKQLNQIKEVLKRILPDVAEVRIAPPDETRSHPRAEFLTPYGWVGLPSLGLGYRTAIAWMVDLAVRLFRRYPDSEDPLAEPAIVLVDEIDLHLHPRWQRMIMSFLAERFPNTQFIVTAHSPLVVQAAAAANIVLLRREGDRVVIDNDPEVVDNWRVDQVLTSVFELPSARAVDLEPLLLRRQKLLAQARLSKADEAELRDLEATIGSLPTAESPDDIKAMDIIRRAAKLLENA